MSTHHSDTRIETDSLGDIAVPASARWGAQTQRAVDTFPISGRQLPTLFIQAAVRINRVASATNRQLDTFAILLRHGMEEPPPAALVQDGQVVMPSLSRSNAINSCL